MKHDNTSKDQLNQHIAEPDFPCSRREARDIEYRNRILTTARQLFATHGIDNISMYQIAQEAGIGQGTLYRRYAHIGEVCADLLRTTTTQFLDSLQSSVKDPAAETTALSQLADIITRTIDFVDDKAALLTVISMTYNIKKNFSPHQKPIYIRLHNIVAPIMSRAISQGEMEPIDVTLTVNTLLTALSPEQYLYHREQLGYSKEAFTAGICRIFVKGL